MDLLLSSSPGLREEFQGIFNTHNPTLKNTTTNLPSELQPFASLRDPQPPEAQEAFQFLLASAVHEGGNPRFGKFGLLNVAEVDGRWHYTFRGAGEVFSVVRPEMGKEDEGK